MNHPDKKRILIVDDERQIRKLLHVILENAGYVVWEAENAETGLRETIHVRPDAIILDLGLPDLDGCDFIKKAREWSTTPILVLSVRNSEADKVKALDLGADDYLNKPFGSEELLARLRNILRRHTQTTESPVICFGKVEVNRAARTIFKDGKEIHLTTKEYALLILLLKNIGKVITHRQILREIWGEGSEDFTHYLRVHMTHLRQKIEDVPNIPRHLLTDSGVGYRLVE
jgi:two-component system KDP operon response regulator KdpE